MPFTGQGLMKIGEKIVLAERHYNNENGFTRNDDFLPERFYTQPGTSGEGIDIPLIDKARFTEELEKYYRMRIEKTEDRSQKSEDGKNNNTDQAAVCFKEGENTLKT